MDSIVSKSSGGRVVARGVYEGPAGDITIPEVDINRASARLLSSAWSVAGGSTGSYKLISGDSGSIYVTLVNSKTVHISNLVKSYSGKDSARVTNKHVPVSWEVISYA